jgi:hypothetical protein
MKSLVKKIANSNFAINLRNSLNIKPVHMNIYNLECISISDAFGWRTDGNFVTKFKYSNILNFFYEIEDCWVELLFYSKNNKILKIVKKNNLDFSNEIVINSDYLNGLKDYGTFYIYHYAHNKINKENFIISNRCYIGYSQNQNLFSFVHGNTLAKFSKISQNKNISSDIVKTSFFMNQNYKIQKYFDCYDKSELLFSNPTSKTIKFSIDENNYRLENGCSILIDVSDKKIINIKSNCLFLRPTIFSYKENYLDVHHG